MPTNQASDLVYCTASRVYTKGRWWPGLGVACWSRST